MKIEVYTDKLKEDFICRVVMVQLTNAVEVIAVDERGERLSHGSIGILDEHGFHATENLDPNVGITRDNFGRVKCS